MLSAWGPYKLFSKFQKQRAHVVLLKKHDSAQLHCRRIFPLFTWCLRKIGSAADGPFRGKGFVKKKKQRPEQQTMAWRVKSGPHLLDRWWRLGTSQNVLDFYLTRVKMKQHIQNKWMNKAKQSRYDFRCVKPKRLQFKSFDRIKQIKSVVCGVRRLLHSRFTCER